MECEIQRIAASELTWEEFDRRFGSTELPVIVTGCESSQQAAADTPWHELIEADSRDIGWYDAPMPTGTDGPTNLVPPLVTQTMERPGAMVRPKPMRLWLQPNHHKTFLHYDGNSLCGFNLQVLGTKSWTLISPDSGLAMAPFNFLMLVHRDFEPDPSRYDVYNFTTEPGDMLFLPRYWVHGVETRSDVNMNVNWVWTPDQPEPTSALGKREVELLRLRRMIPLVDYLVGDKTSTYGGAGESLVDAYISNVSASRALARFAKEVAYLPLMLWRLPSILKQLRMFSDNNFNVTAAAITPPSEPPAELVIDLTTAEATVRGVRDRDSPQTPTNNRRSAAPHPTEFARRS